MNTFSKVGNSSPISNTPGGVWRIEKKRKARDKKNKQQKNRSGEQRNAEEDDSILIDIEFDNANDKENEDLTGYDQMKTKKPLPKKIDLKI